MSAPIAASEPPIDDTVNVTVEQIESLRGQINSLDDEIVRLIAKRAEVSASVQAARIQAGGTRLELGRERVVIDRYRAGLGARGPILAEVVLRLCRGER